jgi:excinuclease ABC subunit C
VSTARGPLRQQLAGLPDSPGVYVFRDLSDRVLYVGKAKLLRKRVHSYFQAPLRPDPLDAREGLGPRAGLHPRTVEMVDRVERLEVVVTGSESEALILEANLVRTHKPPFNVRLRDDKSYPYIGISLDESYPRVYFTREPHRRERMYFGPFSSASKVRETLNVIAKIFPSRPCEGTEPGRPTGIPCLDYHIHRCLAPCVDYISRDEYNELIQQIIEFLSGRYRHLERDLERRMSGAAAAQDYERAAVWRNRLAAVRHLMERQWATNESVGSVDVLGIALEGDTANVQVLQVRDGVLQDRQSFFLDTAGADEAEALEGFALTYYASASAIPPLVVVPLGLTVGEPLHALLTDRRGTNVEVRAAERGDKRRLAELAERNARFALDQERRRHERTRERRREALDDLRTHLGLEAVPIRIECFDVSNLGETHSVASMVVFEQGAAARPLYRNFTLRYEGGPDDFARMHEAVSRRLARLGGDESDRSFAARPSLLVIDGGKGQLGAALQAMADAGVDDIPVIGLAKRLEEVFVPGRSDPIPLDVDSAGSRLLQEIRDEAHRVALRHHRTRRAKAVTGSVFDDLPGVGPARRSAILRHFGSPERALAASREEMSAVPGLPAKVARDIYDRLHKTAAPGGAAAETAEAATWN